MSCTCSTAKRAPLEAPFALQWGLPTWACRHEVEALRERLRGECWAAFASVSATKSDALHASGWPVQWAPTRFETNDGAPLIEWEWWGHEWAVELLEAWGTKVFTPSGAVHPNLARILAQGAAEPEWRDAGLALLRTTDEDVFIEFHRATVRR